MGVDLLRPWVKSVSDDFGAKIDIPFSVVQSCMALTVAVRTDSIWSVSGEDVAEWTLSANDLLISASSKFKSGQKNLNNKGLSTEP